MVPIDIYRLSLNEEAENDQVALHESIMWFDLG
jgi:hypothetical protein